jgi:MFS family permease
VLVLLLAVDEPSNVTPTAKKLQWQEVRNFPRAYWMVVLLGSVFTLARFSEAFLVLRGQQLGLGLTLAPTILVVLGATYAVSAYPAGYAADRMPPTRLLVAGLMVLIMSDVTFAYAKTATSVLIGAGLWGIHLGLTQGLFSKLVADTAPAKLIGTGFGVFNLLSGAALLIASSLAGWLWDTAGPAWSFEMGAAFAAVTAIGLMLTGTDTRAR